MNFLLPAYEQLLHLLIFMEINYQHNYTAIRHKIYDRFNQSDSIVVHYLAARKILKQFKRNKNGHWEATAQIRNLWGVTYQKKGNRHIYAQKFTSVYFHNST
jgi:hypothetical protein